jgi:prepilin-type N-terminal cleavage/methylation domain-containing protein
MKRREINRRELWRQLKKAARDQRGFTLIELLVVIAIMGILAAVVTMSMVGITKIAQDRAAATEEQTVQVAYDTMLADQGVPSGSECAGAGGSSNDMFTWPSPAWTSDVPTHLPVALAPHYLRGSGGLKSGGATTHGTYSCTGNGLINQVSYSP